MTNSRIRITSRGRSVLATRHFVKGARLDQIRGRHSSAATPLTIQMSLFRHLVPARPWCFLNHDCDPSCDVQVKGGRIHLVARRNIRSGDELTFDYATTERRLASAAPAVATRTNAGAD